LLSERKVILPIENIVKDSRRRLKVLSRGNLIPTKLRLEMKMKRPHHDMKNVTGLIMLPDFIQASKIDIKIMANSVK